MFNLIKPLSPKEKYNKEIKRLKLLAIDNGEYKVKIESCSLYIKYENKLLEYDVSPSNQPLYRGVKEYNHYENVLINNRIYHINKDYVRFIDNSFILKILNKAKEDYKIYEKEEEKKKKQEEEKKRDEEDEIYNKKLLELSNLPPLGKAINKACDTFLEIEKLTKENEKLNAWLEKNLKKIATLQNNLLAKEK